MAREAQTTDMDARTAAGSGLETELARRFDEFRLRDGASPAAAARRFESFERFARVGVPSRRTESWHFTDLRAAMRAERAPAPAKAAAAAPERLGPHALRLVTVNGIYRPDLSDADRLPVGVRVRSLAEVLAESDEAALDLVFAPGLSDDPMVALNAAMASGGLFIEVAAGARIEQSLEWTDGVTEKGAETFSRSVLRLGTGARLSLVQSGGATSNRRSNAALVASLAEDAELDLAWAAVSGAAEAQIDSLLVTLGGNAKLRSTALIVDASFLRRQIFARFDGPGAEANFTGLSMLRGTERADNTLVLSHVAPHCSSRELFKHVIDENAVGVFQGKIIVAPGAQKTDASMASRTILLSDGAGMDNKPELEIFADDVVCGHGATCGDLDEDQLFYVMSRGLPPAAAEALLLEAFAAEALEQASDPAVREVLLERARRWLARRQS